jgi:hypothetical protein
MLTPSLFGRNFTLSTSLGVKDAERVGGEVVGWFKSELLSFEGVPDGRLIEKFLNWPDDPQSITQFTRDYGPLKIGPVPGKEFRFRINEFRVLQRQLRSIWKDLGNHAEQDLWKGGSLRFSGGSVYFIANTLYWYLYVDLITTRLDRARVCKRDQCGHPYFIAGHLKQRFCSDECAAEGQRELKKEWWDKHGQAWRLSRRDEHKAEEKKRGATKTR